jgi:hypothetical protein
MDFEFCDVSFSFDCMLPVCIWIPILIFCFGLSGLFFIFLFYCFDLSGFFLFLFYCFGLSGFALFLFYCSDLSGLCSSYGSLCILMPTFYWFGFICLNYDFFYLSFFSNNNPTFLLWHFLDKYWKWTIN